MSKYNPCPCRSKELYHKCCKQFHEGVAPDSALSLMRSRYSAYAMEMPDYIIDTTHPDNPAYSSDRPGWHRELAAFSRITTFEDLRILESEESKSTAVVKFKAMLRQGERDISFTETSRFEKVDGRWLYKDGDIESA
ncbi:MAG: YchJ family protein [Candidatus Obscuribacterales bacterium]